MSKIGSRTKEVPDAATSGREDRIFPTSLYRRCKYVAVGYKGVIFDADIKARYYRLRNLLFMGT